jgi:putative DNA primase/helicase
MPYSSDLLPPSIGAAVDDIAEQMQCPPDYPAASMLVAMAAVVGCRLGIRPRVHGNWLVVPNLWGCVIGRPSLKKTPATRAAVDQLESLEARAKAELKAELDEAELDAIMFKVKQSTIEKSMRAAINAGDEATARQEAERLRDLSSTLPPTPRRIIVNRTTIEKLCELLSRHPAGLFLFIDELVGWLRAMDKSDQAGVRDQYNTLWNGIGKIRDDTIGRGENSAENGCVSVFGCFTPGPLSEYVTAAVRGGRGDDGLINRLQITVWPDSPKDYNPVDQPICVPAFASLRDTFEQLADIVPSDIGENDPLMETGIPFVHFDTEGQRMFNDWDLSFNRRVRGGDYPAAFESHLSKYNSMVPSIALLLHLASGGRGPVGATSMATALRWAQYLESHARRLYCVGIESEGRLAGELLPRLIDWKLDSPIRASVIAKKGWSGLTSKPVVENVLGVLAEAGWVQAIKAGRGKAGGRPTDNWLVHPEAGKFLAKYQARTRETPKTTPDAGFGGFRGADFGQSDEIEVTV